jgi:hypothetical protein
MSNIRILKPIVAAKERYSGKVKLCLYLCLAEVAQEHISHLIETDVWAFACRKIIRIIGAKTFRQFTLFPQSKRPPIGRTHACRDLCSTLRFRRHICPFDVPTQPLECVSRLSMRLGSCARESHPECPSFRRWHGIHFGDALSPRRPVPSLKNQGPFLFKLPLLPRVSNKMYAALLV